MSIQAIPVEILSEIFTIGCDEINLPLDSHLRDGNWRRCHFKSHTRRKKTFASIVGHVCTVWRDILLMQSNSHFWETALSIGWGTGLMSMQHELQMFRTRLANSMGSDLSVVIGLQYANRGELEIIKDAVHELMTYSPQLRLVSGVADERDVQSFASAFLSFLECTSHPRLVYLSFFGKHRYIRFSVSPLAEYLFPHGSETKRIGNSAIHFQGLRIPSRFNWGSIQYPRHLRTITAGSIPTDNWTVARHILQCCPHLTRLDLEFDPSDRGSVLRSPDAYTTCEGIRTLSLAGTTRAQILFLSAFHFPNLESIEFSQTDYPYDVDFLELCPNFPSIETKPSISLHSLSWTSFLSNLNPIIAWLGSDTIKELVLIPGWGYTYPPHPDLFEAPSRLVLSCFQLVFEWSLENIVSGINLSNITELEVKLSPDATTPVIEQNPRCFHSDTRTLTHGQVAFRSLKVIVIRRFPLEQVTQTLDQIDAPLLEELKLYQLLTVTHEPSGLFRIDLDKRCQQLVSKVTFLSTTLPPCLAKSTNPLMRFSNLEHLVVEHVRRDTIDGLRWLIPSCQENAKHGDAVLLRSLRRVDIDISDNPLIWDAILDLEPSAKELTEQIMSSRLSCGLGGVTISLVGCGVVRVLT